MRQSITLLLVLLAAPCHAHKDMFILWNDDGTLERLPAEYQPAKLSVDFHANPGSEPGIKSFSLTIAGKSVSLPSCLTGLVQTPGKEAVQLLASWYHDVAITPPYLVVQFHSADPKLKPARKSVSFHFNLPTGRLRSVSMAEHATGDNRVQHSEVQVAKICSRQEVATIMDSADMVWQVVSPDTAALPFHLRPAEPTLVRRWEGPAGRFSPVGDTVVRGRISSISF